MNLGNPDYLSKESIPVIVFDRKHKKRKRLTLSVPSKNRDRAKSLRAPFANFIHQIDASIAMFVILECFD